MTQDIVERLRSHRQAFGVHYEPREVEVCIEAAATISRLTADNEALRKEVVEAAEARAAHHRTSHKAVKRLRALWREKQAAEARADALAQEVERTKQNYVDANEAHLDCIRTLERIADARMPGQARRLAVEQLRLSKAIVAALANEEAGL